MHLSPGQQNTLATIQRLGEVGDVRVSDLASALAVKRATVSRSVKGLVQDGLVDHEPYGRIALTPAGEAEAAAIARRIRCANRLLVELLDLDPARARVEAWPLALALGDEVLGRLEILTGFALSSDAWVKRLHHRLGPLAPPNS